MRTIKMGQWACQTTLSETLPIRARRSPPSPRLPMTMRPAPISSLRRSFAWSLRSPVMRWAPERSPGLFDPPHLLVDHLLNILPYRFGRFFVGFVAKTGFMQPISRVRTPRTTETMCSSELVQPARSTAVWAASAASPDPSVASKIFVGKMLIPDLHSRQTRRERVVDYVTINIQFDPPIPCTFLGASVSSPPPGLKSPGVSTFRTYRPLSLVEIYSQTV